MATIHLEVLVEEPSMEAFLRALLPRLLPLDKTFQIHVFQGKNDLLDKIRAPLARLCGVVAGGLGGASRWLWTGTRTTAARSSGSSNPWRRAQACTRGAVREGCVGNWSIVLLSKNSRLGTSATGKQCKQHMQVFSAQHLQPARLSRSRCGRWRYMGGVRADHAKARIFQGWTRQDRGGTDTVRLPHRRVA